MRKLESYYLKDGKLDLSLLNEEIHPESKPITYHTIKTIHEIPLNEHEKDHTSLDHAAMKEKLYGSKQTYEILRDMGAYLSNTVDEQGQLDVMSYEVEEETTEEAEGYEVEEEATEEAEGYEVEEEATEEAEGYEVEEEATEEAEGYEVEEEATEEAEGYEVEEEATEEAEDYEVEQGAIDETYQVVGYGQILSVQVSDADKALMKQYEQPLHLVEEEKEIKKIASKIETFRAYQLKLLQGRVLTQDIKSSKGILVGKAGERITAEMLERAKDEGTLIKIILKYL